MISTRSAGLLIDTVVCLTLAKWETVSGRFGGYLRSSLQVGEIVFLLSRHPVFADEPSLVPGQMLLALVPDPLWWSVGDPYPDSGETSLELSFRAGAPTNGAPFGGGQHILGRYR